MPKTALTVVPVARTPQRDRLAGTIAERTRIAELIRAREAKRQEEADQGLNIRSEIYRLEDELKRPRRQYEYEREEALLRGEEPTNVPTVASIKAEIATLQAQAADSHEVEGRLAQDCELLRHRLQMTEMGVADAIHDVVEAEVDRGGLIALHARLSRQAAFLARAIEGPATVYRIGEPAPMVDLSVRASSLPACPWAAAVERLNTDPDAPLPTVEAALALIPEAPAEPEFGDAA